MQSISAVEVFISNTTKLFSSPKELFLERYKMRNTARKNFIIPTLCTLVSLPVHATTENITAFKSNAANSVAVIPANNTAITVPASNAGSPKAVVAPTNNVAKPAVVVPGNNNADPATITAPADNAISPKAIVAPTNNVAKPATVVPDSHSADPATITVPASNAAGTKAVVAPTGNVANPAAAVVAPASNDANPANNNAISPAAIPVTDVAVTRPANEIGNLIAGKQHPYLTQSDFTYRVADLDELYQASGYQPIWLSSDNSKNADEVIKLLEQASEHGLNPADYETAMLRQKLGALKAPLDMQSKDLALYDTAISVSLLRFMYDVHYGRVNPRNLNFNIQQRTEKTLDIPALIKTGLAQNTLSQLPTLAEPKLPQYQKLKQALRDYRVTQRTPPLKLVAKSTIRPGNPLPQSVELQQFLSALGDLPTDKVDNTATTYTDTIVEAVKKYQQQHGLKANGIINKATVAAFAKSSGSSQKATQIELAMERLRWLPEITEGRAVMVNIPAFQLFAYDDINQDSPTTTMRVVVGKAAKNQTPLLTADMRFVDFHPFWNVPFKIARDEILPKLAADPDYLVRQNMEFVSGSGNRALRIRQRPGKGNALGKVKFIFPNKSDVYLHDTPSVSLFGRARRDLSHGCVRVARPEELANFVLREQGNWDETAIKKAIKSSRNQRVVLKSTIPVLFLYNTAFFNENNNLAFYTDIYRLDDKLLTELKKPRKDLSDKELFAPKELPPPADEESNTNRIEALHDDHPVTTASAKQVTKEVKPVSSSGDTTLSP